MQQDGQSASLTAPNGGAQRRLLNSVGRHGISFGSENLSLEAHGTGTALGDPIEVGAVIGALSNNDKSCCTHEVGDVTCTSLKANMGHLEAAAAAVSLQATFAMPLCVGFVYSNALLHRLNAHVVNLISPYKDQTATSRLRL